MPEKNEVKIVITGDSRSAQEALRKVNADLRGMSADMGGLVSAIRGHWLGITAAITGAYFAIKGVMDEVIFKVADHGEQLLKMSQQTGIAVDKLSGLKYAAEQSESSIEALITGSRIFAKALTGINDEGEDTTKVMKALKVTSKDPYEAILQVADAFSKMEDGAGKTTIAVKLFGRGAMELIPLLNQGSAGIRNLHDEAVRLGIVFDEDMAKASDTFNDNINRLKKNAEGLAHSIGNILIPALNDLFAAFGKSTKAENLYSQLAYLDREIARMEQGFLGLKPKEGSIARQQIDRMKKERKEINDLLWDLQSPKEKDKAPELPDTKALDAAKKLAEQWKEVSAALRLDLAQSGLDEFDRKLLQIHANAEKLRQKFGEEPLILKWELQMSVDTLQQQMMADEEAGIRQAKERAEKVAAAGKWLTDRTNKLALSEFDYKRSLLLAEYQESANVIGWTEDLYNNLKVAIAKIDDEEKDHRLKTLMDIQQAEIQNQLAIISLREKNSDITRRQANEARLALRNQELSNLRQEYDDLKGIADKELERLKILERITGVQSEIVDLTRQQKELTGTLAEGAADAAKKYRTELKTAFEEGAEAFNATMATMQSSLEDFVDYSSDKFGDFGDLAKSVIHEIYMELMKLFLIKPLMNDLSELASGFWGLVGGISGGGSGMTSEMTGWDLFHKGGLVGAKVRHDGGVIDTARYIPRFHFGGLNPDERVTINKVGERYITQEQNEWLTNITKTVTNQGTRNVSVENIFNNVEDKRLVSRLREEINNTVRRVIKEYV